LALALCLATFVIVGDAFSLEMEITQTGDGHQHVNVIHGDDQGEHAHDYTFLSKIRKQMHHLAAVSQQVFHKSPLDGLFDDVNHLFEDRHGADPFSSLSELAHRTRSRTEGAPELKHRDFQNMQQRSHQPMLAIMDMVRQMTRPLLAESQHLVVPLRPGPPRGLVALACHRDAVQYCQEFCSCWHGMTQCLAEHVNQIQPRCKHLLEASGVFKEHAQDAEAAQKEAEAHAEAAQKEAEAHAEAAQQNAEHKKELLREAREKEAEMKEEAEEKEAEAKKASSLLEAAQKGVEFARRPPPLSMQAALQTMHDSLKEDIGATRAAARKDTEEDHATDKDESPATDKAEDTTDKAEDMSEDTPAWITGDIEAPGGEKDMGGWTMRAYTPEQQARLNVDEMGEPVPASAKKAPEEQHKPTTKAAAKHSWFHEYMVACKQRLNEAWGTDGHWVIYLAGGVFLVALLIAFMVGQSRKRRNDALHHRYTHITEMANAPMVTTTFGSENQI